MRNETKATEKHFALIMATGQSKRIPMKNIADICGRPAISYVIEIAKAAGVFSNIVVSTDNKEIAKVGEEWGAEILFRPSEWEGLNYMDSLAASVSLWREGREEEYPYVTQMFGTAIFWRPSWIRRADKILRDWKESGKRVGRVMSTETMVQSLWLSPIGIISPTIPITHKGISIDIDYPEELELARQVMAQIVAGRISYPLEENVHEIR